MPRQKVNVPEDTMISCPRCSGDGVIGQRNGVDVPCPACGGDGRIDSRNFRSYQNYEERRYASYDGDPTFNAVGRETATVALTRLVAPDDMVADSLAGIRRGGEDVSPGHILVAPIRGGSSQQFAVIGGFDALAAAVREGRSSVPIEVATTIIQQPVLDAADLSRFLEDGGTDAE